MRIILSQALLGLALLVNVNADAQEVNQRSECFSNYDPSIALKISAEYRSALEARDYARLKQLRAKKEQLDLWKREQVSCPSESSPEDSASSNTGSGNTAEHEEGEGHNHDTDTSPNLPQEAGWWTGRNPGSKNTIKCDGNGDLVVHQGTVLPHGLGQCTIEHEEQHVADWLDRYGENICAGRQNGDLPHFRVPGKDSYNDFLKKSECSAWTIGLTCRESALSNCTTPACTTYVNRQVTFGRVKKTEYCGA